MTTTEREAVEDHVLSPVYASLKTQQWHIGCKCGWISPGDRTSKAARDTGRLHLDPPEPTGWQVVKNTDGGYVKSPFEFKTKAEALVFLEAKNSVRRTPEIYETKAGHLVFKAEHRALAAAITEGK